MAEDGRACYVYGVVTDDRPDESVKDLPAVGDPEAPVTLVRQGGQAAVVSEVPVDKPLGTPEDLRTHARVLDHLAAQGSPVLPFRFGTVVRDTAAVADELLVEGHDDFARGLDRLRGRTQLTVRARYDEDAVLREVVTEQPEARRLRDELRGLPEDAGYEQRIELGQLVMDSIAAKRSVDALELDRRLAPYALGSVSEEPSPEGLINASFLVEDAKRQAFEEAAEELAAHWHGRVRMRLLGPLAPYDFVADATLEGDATPEGDATLEGKEGDE
ncbi:GvpL/GvpF family gas vesicle protein [Streptomyces rhizosphaericus]|uniref:GvpL/GvpF family gas vesicle protein n=1 Tax=Streptomyces rhizosphaericus TaxID=114699 RepID=A0A6G4AFK8_9ACTN|nr:GvpL/GvpF family gas vesicle protein [Streptomyces rhizosphaericus]NEW72143.1 GvpL/GvpF family gas vesicle protein [Streptomyces rhizosphaericus]